MDAITSFASRNWPFHWGTEGVGRWGWGGSTAPTTTLVENDVFHVFSQLPPELRHAIWMLYLENIRSPRVYYFIPCYPKRLTGPKYRPDLQRSAKPGDPIILAPHGYTKHYRNQLHHSTGEWSDLEDFKEATLAARTAAATCAESREIVCGLLPDTLTFRKLRNRELVDKDDNFEAVIDLSSTPEHVLRFSGARDILILKARWADQHRLVELSRLQGVGAGAAAALVPPVFKSVQHLGLTSTSISRSLFQTIPWKATPGECECETAKCDDCCKEDPLPSFLSTLFPNLKTLYIATHDAEPTIYTHDNGAPPCDGVCRCEAGHPAWPIVRAGDGKDEFVAYDERSGCSFPPIAYVENTRVTYRRHFPYYKALGHLDIKFLCVTEKEQ
ncbi:hypothetical protein BX600DRAFT_519383 [Xylariales sp. PMI_506]|nr:hypothetical protein BX600DRAFT_519383 [Xylariales sp. PMI_506]